MVQLYLLVAFSRVQRKGIKHCNFQTAYNEYRTLLITNAQTCETFSQSVCLRAFEVNTLTCCCAFLVSLLALYAPFGSVSVK